MIDMVEKVARAICGHAGQGFCADVGGDLGCKRGRGESYNGSNCIASRDQLVMTQHWDQARAAIEAMREPPEKVGEWDHGREIWQDMIDAALLDRK